MLVQPTDLSMSSIPKKYYLINQVLCSHHGNCVATSILVPVDFVNKAELELLEDLPHVFAEEANVDNSLPGSIFDYDKAICDLMDKIEHSEKCILISENQGTKNEKDFMVSGIYNVHIAVPW